ncbi:MAG: MFS transporter [Acidobacteriota bacterium]
MSRQQKLVWISILYFAEGFPFGIANDVWPIYFRRSGVDLKAIGLMSLLFLPYTLKAAWAPIVDKLGSRQIWIASCEVLLGVAALAVLAFDPAHPTPALWGILLCFTILSATQDVAIDGYAVDVATPGDSGAINGIRVMFYRIALIAGGGALVSATAWIGWKGVFVGGAILCFAQAFLTFASPRAPRDPAPPETESELRFGSRQLALVGLTGIALMAGSMTGWPSWATTIAVVMGGLTLGSFLQPELLRWAITPHMLPVFLFVLLFKVGDSALGKMVKPFWVDRGLTDREIGLISTTLGLVLTILGGLAGGWFVARRGVYRALVWLGIAQLVSNFGYVYVAAADLGRWGIYGASMIESFCQGLGTTAFLSFLMNLCDRRQGATQFALLSSTFALSRDVAGAFSGFGVVKLGYAVYFTLTALIALPALALLPVMRSRIREDPVEPSPAA